MFSFLKKLIIFILFINVIGVKAQLNRHVIDTIKFDLKQKKKLYVSLDYKNTFVSDLSTKMFGLQLGYIFNKRTSLYIGYYAANETRKEVANPTAVNGNTDSNTIYQYYGLNYFNIGIDYIFYNTKRWRFSIPLSIGLGSGYSHLSSLKTNFGTTKTNVVPLEFALYGSYKITWWIWFGAGMGSRIMLNNKSGYNGTFYSIGIQLKTGEIYRRTKNWVEKKF